jgi:hypothetical protein
MQRIDDDRDRADDSRDMRKHRQRPQNALTGRRPVLWAKRNRWFRARRKTSLSVFVFSCAHGASRLDSCAIIFPQATS